MEPFSPERSVGYVSFRESQQAKEQAEHVFAPCPMIITDLCEAEADKENIPANLLVSTTRRRVDTLIKTARSWSSRYYTAFNSGSKSTLSTPATSSVSKDWE
ncbi:hypothetical protein PYW08_000108 [Mythimna loreyi]|uniref:Uncharacterized protein n=1 Tax=Mythimna loreyi TaxID=667449 RepID=A0ACC2RAG3_9NEOP|nr:hypothetical protein PYW08_000108 [Mythimna loreyi]